MIAKKYLLSGWLFGFALTLAATAEAGVNEWTAQGPNGGYVYSLAIDPVTPSTLYAGAPFDGGVFKSIDGGDSWKGISNGLPRAQVEAFAIDPVAPTTVYCGTWQGVYKTIDGGESWVSSPEGSSLGQVKALVLDPSSTSTLYAGTASGLFKSTDSAETWVDASQGLGGYGVSALAIDSSNPSILYAGNNDGVFRSTDGGGHWTEINNGLEDRHVGVLVIDPVDPEILYTGGSGVHKTTDGGAHWTAMNNGLELDEYSVLNIETLAIDPTAPATVYAGSVFGFGGLYKTVNGGAHWQPIAGPAAYGSGLDDPDIRAVVIDPTNPKILFAGTSDQLECAYHSEGLYRSTDGGETWAVANVGLSNSDVLALALDPSAPSTLWAGIRYGGSQETLDGGASWHAVAGDRDPWVTALAIDPLNPSIRYSAFLQCIDFPENGIIRTIDGVETNVSLGVYVDIRQLIIDPVTPSTLFAVTGSPFRDAGVVYKSVNRGDTWAAVTDDLPETTIMAFGPTAGHLYAGTLDGVYKSADRGDSWAAANAGLEEVRISALAVASADPEVIYAGTDNGVYKSVDGGAVWFAAGLGSRRITALAVDSRRPFVLYAGTTDGVFRSTDGGGSWSSFETGLGGALVRTLVIDPQNPEKIYAATDRGVFDIIRVEPCVASDLNLCLSAERFRVEVDWRSFDGTTGTGGVVPVGSEDSGLMWFFEADNWELLVKVLDGCAINNRFWVFAAATTTVEYTLRITDTVTGAVREYRNELGTAAAAITDSAAFDGCSAGDPAAASDRPRVLAPFAAVAQRLPEPVADAQEGVCIPSATRMCLSSGRFAVDVRWRDAADNMGDGRVVDVGTSDASGLFWFFSPANWEMLVKVLDACETNGRFLFLGAASTDVEYTLTVTDLVADESWEVVNPLGSPSAAWVQWFETCS